MNTRSIALRAVEYRIYFVLLAAILILAMVAPGFVAGSTLTSVLQGAAFNGLMGLGLTVVLIAGQLDLSLGSTVALSGMAAIGLQPFIGAPLAAVVGVSAGSLVGILNGVLVAFGRINGMIATLATMLGIRALALTITGSRPVVGVDLNFGLIVDQPILGPITLRIAAFLMLAIVVQYVLLNTNFGRNLYAIGGNVEAARLSGIRSDRHIFLAYVVSGTASGLAGTILALSLNTGSPNVDANTIIIVLAAVVVSGTSLAGGTGDAMRTVAGILLISTLVVGMNIMDVPSYYQSVSIGTILIAVILLDRVSLSYGMRSARLASARAMRHAARVSSLEPKDPPAHEASSAG